MRDRVSLIVTVGEGAAIAIDAADLDEAPVQAVRLDLAARRHAAVVYEHAQVGCQVRRGRGAGSIGDTGPLDRRVGLIGMDEALRIPVSSSNDGMTRSSAAIIGINR